MKVGVVTFPGSNCDEDTRDVYSRILKAEVQALWHKDVPSLSGYQMIILPGGFSFGDYLRSGAISALSPIMAEVKNFASNGGLVLGICNGFQILCEAHLLPGALVQNVKRSFLCQDVSVRVENTDTPWTYSMEKEEILELPIAHGDGRYVAEQETLKELESGKQILLRYVQDNPNGSTEAIAGICNEKKNVFGLMPHPERATDLRSKHGMKFWTSIEKWLKEARS